METWRKILIAVVLVLSIFAIWLTWGSIFSIIMTMGILLGGCALLLQKFVFCDRDNDYWGDQNG